MGKLGNDILISFEEDNQQELLYKFLRQYKFELEWADFVYQAYEESISEQEPPDDPFFQDDEKQIGD
jgi:hypothetical protein